MQRRAALPLTACTAGVWQQDEPEVHHAGKRPQYVNIFSLIPGPRSAHGYLMCMKRLPQIWAPSGGTPARQATIWLWRR